MKASIDWQGQLTFSGTADSGHTITIDGPPALGGENSGFRPMELVLLGLGGCSAMDVVYILQKARHSVHDCRVELEATRAETDPKVFTDVHMRFVVSGDDLKEQQVARAVQLSADKYCSASIMLSASVNITHDYRIESAPAA